MMSGFDPTVSQRIYSKAVFERGYSGSSMDYFIELFIRLRRVYASIFLSAIVIFFVPERFLDGEFTLKDYSPGIYRIMMTILQTSVELMLQTNVQIIVSSPLTTISIGAQVALILSVILNTPFLLWNIYQFAAPGLYTHEKRILREGMFILVGLFFLGASIAYFIVTPTTLNVLTVISSPLINYGNGEVPLALFFTLESIYSIIIWTVFSAGLLYMIPGIIYLLVVMEIIDPEYLVKNRKSVILAVLTFAAVITPDPTMVSMLVLSGPLLVVYEATIQMGYRNRFSRKIRSKNVWRQI